MKPMAYYIHMAEEAQARGDLASAQFYATMGLAADITWRQLARAREIERREAAARSVLRFLAGVVFIVAVASILSVVAR